VPDFAEMGKKKAAEATQEADMLIDVIVDFIRDEAALDRMSGGPTRGGGRKRLA